MSKRIIVLTEKIRDYILSNSLRETDLLKELRFETARDKKADWQIAPEQGQFMSLLIKLINAKKTLEIGVYTGYSTLVTALALPSNGKIIACDISNKWLDIAKKYWHKAGVLNRIDFRLGPADKTLTDLIKRDYNGTFDFVFIDADKENYDYYYESCLKLTRRGGLILIDNVLWRGRVVDQSFKDIETVSIRNLNKKINADKRVDLTIIPMADGLTLTRKR